MKMILLSAFMLSTLSLVSCCTISINMVHTSGSASDVVDEDQKADNNPTVSTNVSVPAMSL
jgi:hypothetical protein